MGNKKTKAISTELTQKRSFIEWLTKLLYIHIFYLIEIALLQANTNYSEYGK